jgi:hypothetical protein
MIAAAIGAGWGFASYLLLWGHTPFVVHRSFVVSVVGTVLLLPVRIVLWAIHELERSAGRSFDLAENNWWIGVVASVVGGGVVALVAWLVRLARGAQAGSVSRRRASASDRSR